LVRQRACSGRDSRVFGHSNGRVIDRRRVKVFQGLTEQVFAFPHSRTTFFSSGPEMSVAKKGCVGQKTQRYGAYIQPPAKADRNLKFFFFERAKIV
jgi:hypothetical protein